MSEQLKDTANIGLSEQMHLKLREMADNGIFNDMQDGYRLAAAIAIKQKLSVFERELQNRKNMYDVGGVDENLIFKNTIRILYPSEQGREYKYLEKLADAGINILFDIYDKHGTLDIGELLSNDT